LLNGIFVAARDLGDFWNIQEKVLVIADKLTIHGKHFVGLVAADHAEILEVGEGFERVLFVEPDEGWIIQLL